MYQANISTLDEIAAVVVAAVSILDYAGDVAMSNQSENTTQVINQLKNDRQDMINYLINNTFTKIGEDNLTIPVLQREAELLSLIVENSQQISTAAGKTSVVAFGSILDKVNSINADDISNNNNNSFLTALNDNTANAIVSGIVNVANAFVLEYDANYTTTIDTATTIELTQIGLNLVMLFKLNNSIPGESGYYYEMNDGSIVNAMRQSVDNLNDDIDDNDDDICGSEYLYYHQIGTILQEKGINQFNCLFSLQASKLYSNVPGDSSISNVLTLDFTTVSDSIEYNVEEIMNNVVNSDVRRRRTLDVDDVINETSMCTIRRLSSILLSCDFTAGRNRTSSWLLRTRQLYRWRPNLTTRSVNFCICPVVVCFSCF